MCCKPREARAMPAVRYKTLHYRPFSPTDSAEEPEIPRQAPPISCPAGHTALKKPGAPATGGGIENHRQNMAECRGQLMAVAFNNAARQPSLAGATGFSGRQRGGASRLSKADAPITSCQAGMDGDSSALHELVPAAFFDPQILLRRPKTFPSSARMTTSTSMASPGFGNT